MFTPFPLVWRLVAAAAVLLALVVAGSGVALEGATLSTDSAWREVPVEDPWAGQALDHATEFTQAKTVAEVVEASARVAGASLNPVAVTGSGSGDPLDRLLAAIDAAHDLQLQAVATLSMEDWDRIAAGGLAATSIHGDVDALRASSEDPWFGGLDAEAAQVVQRGLDSLELVDDDKLWQAVYVLAHGVDEYLATSMGGVTGVFQAISTPLGDVVIDDRFGGCDDLYVSWYLLIIDNCGDDQYDAPAGGADLLGLHPISIVIDTEGDDVVNPTMSDVPPFDPLLPAQGAATNAGIAIAIDTVGNEDRSTALLPGDLLGTYGGFVGGAGTNAGFGFLIDLEGMDDNRVNGFTLPAGKWGSGFNGGVGVMVDGGGDDRYGGDEFEEGSGWFAGVGILADLGGNDFYYDLSTFSQGSGGVQGVGLLVDVMGDDMYETPSPYEQGAGGCGIGMLVDLAGQDVYQAGPQAQGYADVIHCLGNATPILPGVPVSVPLLGVGVLLDLEGEDTYLGGSLVQGAHLGPAVGVLADLAGHDVYDAGNCAQGFGDSLGLSFCGWALIPPPFDAILATIQAFLNPLVCPISIPDPTLDAVWQTATGPICNLVGGTGVGALVDRLGFDSYTLAGADGQGVAYGGSFGVFVDGAGLDAYVSGGVPPVDGGGLQAPRGTTGIVLELP